MTVPELELAQRTQHCVPGKSKNPATPVREVLASRFLVVFFEPIEDWLMAEEAPSPICRRPMLADAS